MPQERRCQDCGADIGDRRRHARLCRPCAAERQREASRRYHRERTAAAHRTRPPRYCRVCSTDISDRNTKARYCADCYVAAKRKRAAVRRRRRYATDPEYRTERRAYRRQWSRGDPERSRSYARECWRRKHRPDLVGRPPDAVGHHPKRMAVQARGAEPERPTEPKPTGSTDWLETVEPLRRRGRPAEPATIFSAIEKGDVERVARMMTSPSAGHYLRSRGYEGATPLHWALALEQLDVADVLVRAGADLEAVDRAGYVPADLAPPGWNPPAQ